jgi:hypothetical protein
MLSKKINYFCISIILIFCTAGDYRKYDQINVQANEFKSIPCGYNNSESLTDSILSDDLPEKSGDKKKN